MRLEPRGRHARSVLRADVPRQRNDRSLPFLAGLTGPDLADESEPVFARQSDVAQDHIGAGPVERVHRLPHGLRSDNIRAGQAQEQHDRIASVRVVFDHEDAHAVEQRLAC